MFQVKNTRSTTFSVIYCFLLQTLQASSDSCDVSRRTVQTVRDCPTSEGAWREAAARKNCAAYASQCNKPERLEYHCIINPFINQTLEVCAYAQNIVLGFCTEYSMSGNIIQESANTDCTLFKMNPCPVFYRSTEAYKYPGCYGLTKKAADPDSTITSPTVKYLAITLSPEDELSGIKDWILIILVAILTVTTLILGFHISGFCDRVKKPSRSTACEQ